MIIRGTTLTSARIGLGTHALHRIAAAGARRSLLELAFDLGIRHFDTAPSYGAGLAERDLGRFLHGRRSELVLTTKFGIRASRLGATLPGWNQAAMAARLMRRLVRGPAAPVRRDYRAQAARDSLEASLRALGTDHVDVFFLHEPALESLRDVEALERTLETLKRDGKIRYAGLSGWEADCAAIARRFPALAEILQIQIPASADGLPVSGYVRPAAAALSIWEFPGSAGRRSSGLLEQTLERLRSADPAGVTLVSTHSPAELRAAAAVLNRPTQQSQQSATSSLPLADGMR